MPDAEPKSLMRRVLEAAIRKAFTRAYQTIKVDPEKYLDHLRMAYGLPAITYDGVFGVELHTARPYCRRNHSRQHENGGRRRRRAGHGRHVHHAA